MIISHDKDRYEPVRIQWNVIRVSNGAQTKGPHLFMLTWLQQTHVVTRHFDLQKVHSCENPGMIHTLPLYSLSYRQDSFERSSLSYLFWIVLRRFPSTERKDPVYTVMVKFNQFFPMFGKIPSFIPGLVSQKSRPNKKRILSPYKVGTYDRYTVNGVNEIHNPYKWPKINEMKWVSGVTSPYLYRGKKF